MLSKWIIILHSSLPEHHQSSTAALIKQSFEPRDRCRSHQTNQCGSNWPSGRSMNCYPEQLCQVGKQKLSFKAFKPGVVHLCVTCVCSNSFMPYSVLLHSSITNEDSLIEKHLHSPDRGLKIHPFIRCWASSLSCIQQKPSNTSECGQIWLTELVLHCLSVLVLSDVRM